MKSAERSLRRLARGGLLSHASALAGLFVGMLLVASALAQLPPAPVEVHHIHGLALDRRDPEVLYVATHTGLVRLRPNAPPEWAGSFFDLMGFTAHPTEAGLLFASGHPDLATYREQKVGNLGLLVSRDGGRTWRSVALQGAADFHALEVASPIGRTVWVAEPTAPALVLGSAQPDTDVRTDAGIEVVRRRSGGGAVLVVPGDVLWVDVIIPAGDELWDDDVGRASHWLGDLWATALGELREHVRSAP